MEKPIFQSSFLGNQTEIYSDRIVYKGLWGILAKITLPLNQIASVNLGPLWMPGALIETSGGQKYGVFLPFQKKRLFQETLINLQKITSNQN